MGDYLGLSCVPSIKWMILSLEIGSAFLVWAKLML